MNKIVYRVGSVIATGALLSSVFVSAAFADSDVVIAGNGNGSNNTATVVNKNTTDVDQTNISTVVTEVNSTANTGGNKANNNVGGDVVIDTGRATSNVNVTVHGSSNTANVSLCGCQGTNDSVLIAGNGNNSTNKAKVINKQKTEVDQFNLSFVATGVSSRAKTGKNKANGNVGTGAGIGTGGARSTVAVTVHQPTNTLNP